MKAKRLIAAVLVAAVMLANYHMTIVTKAEETDAVSDAATVSTEATTEVQTTQEATTQTVKKAQKKKTTKKKSKKVKTKKGNLPSYTKSDLRYMSSIIYCEAGNQPYAGKLAVGIVVKNRMESKRYPSSIKGVLYQRYQFSPARNGSLARALRTYDKGGFSSTSYYKQCVKAAKAALSGEKKVTYKGKTTHMKGYYCFNGYVSGAKLRIAGHMFK